MVYRNDDDDDDDNITAEGQRQYYDDSISSHQLSVSRNFTHGEFM